MKALELIKDKRKEKKISQETMADKLNMARSTYQALESGQNNMNIIDFFKIIEILEIPLSLFAGEEIIMIEKNDFIKIKQCSNELNKIINRINENNNITIGNNSNVQIGANISYNKGEK